MTSKKKASKKKISKTSIGEDKKKTKGKRGKAAVSKAERNAGKHVTPPVRDRSAGIELAGVAMLAEPDQQGLPVVWQEVRWSDGGFELEHGADGVLVPVGQGGRYQVMVAARWVRFNGNPFTVEQAKKGYLRAAVTLDGGEHEAVNALQSAAAPARGAHGSTQHMTWELELEEGAMVGLRVAQSVGPELQADAALLLRRV